MIYFYNYNNKKNKHSDQNISKTVTITKLNKELNKKKVIKRHLHYKTVKQPTKYYYNSQKLKMLIKKSYND